MKRILSLAVLTSLLLSPTFVAAQGEPTLKAGETFTLRISGVPPEDSAAINGPYTISNSGMIRLHLLDPVSASGLTPSALSSRIEQTYKQAEIYTKPTVNVIVSGGGPQERYVTVMGEVAAQGPVPYNPNLTLLAAVAQARGFSDFANREQVIVVRNGERTIHDLSRAGTKDDIVLKPGDTVVVRDKKAFGGLFDRGKKDQ
ncbi:MAG: polysaccharide biosynthesis/export family protein [Verrucomicrobiota bacterium]